MSLLAALGFEKKSDSGSTTQSKPVALAKMGALGAMAAFLPGETLQASNWNGVENPSFISLLTGTAVWMGAYAIAYSVALTIGQNRYLHRPWLGSREITVTVAGGALIGFVSGGIAQFFFSIAVAVGQGNIFFVEVARVAAWAIFGALIGLGMSFIIPNLGRMHGLVGGAAGGAVGAVGFIASGLIAGDAAGRFVGMAVVGGALGYAIGRVEEVARTAWLQVGYGNSKETVRVSLGKEPVCVGSHSQRCAIWAKGARPVALRFRYIDSQVLCDDMASERSFVVDPGFQQQVGNVHLLVCVGNAPAATTSTNSNNSVHVPQQSSPRPPAPPPMLARPKAGNPAASVTPVSPSIARSPVNPGRLNQPPPPPPPPPTRR